MFRMTRKRRRIIERVYSAVYEHDGPEADAWTAFYRPEFCNYPDKAVEYVAMSAMPSHPQGIGLHEELPTYMRQGFGRRRAETRRDLADLPDGVKEFLFIMAGRVLAGEFDL